MGGDAGGLKGGIEAAMKVMGKILQINKIICPPRQPQKLLMLLHKDVGAKCSAHSRQKIKLSKITYRQIGVSR